LSIVLDSFQLSQLDGAMQVEQASLQSFDIRSADLMHMLGIFKLAACFLQLSLMELKAGPAPGESGKASFRAE
jgi:hypothetical protein